MLGDTVIHIRNEKEEIRKMMMKTFTFDISAPTTYTITIKNHFCLVYFCFISIDPISVNSYS